MDLKTFFEYFDTLAEAPKGIQRLRELILDMAVRGKLVPQDPADEPANKLVSKNQQKILISRTGKRKALPEISDSDSVLPLGWNRCRLADVALVEMGNSPPGSTYNQHGDGVPLINGPVEFTKGPFGLTVVNQYTTAPSRMCESGDLLVCVRGATTGRTNIAAFNACIGRGVASIRAWDAQQYINYLMWWFGEKLLQQGKGTTFPSISYGDLAGLEIFLPPLAEQKRIVAKVDELMALCDALEAAQQTRNTLRQNLRASALDGLMNASSDTDLETAWAFVRDNWGLMCDRPEDVEGLRQVVLQVAVQGRLGTQDQSDEDVSALLTQIGTTKKKLIKEGKLKNYKDKRTIDDENRPFNIPDSWTWAKINDFYDVSGGIQKTPQRRPVKNFFPYLRVANVQRNALDLGEIEYFELLDSELERWKLEKGDLLIIEGNGSAKEIGRCAVWYGEIENCVHQNHIIRARPLGHDGQLFTLTFLNSPSGMAEMKRLAITTSGLYSLSVGKIRDIVIPLPPLAEQKRIVAKVDKLMKLCDQLEENLRQQYQSVENFLTSMLSCQK